jgi:hypothetical protein
MSEIWLRSTDGILRRDETEVSVKNLPPLTSALFYRGADKSLARPTFRFILFDGENISFDASLVIYI